MNVVFLVGSVTVQKATATATAEKRGATVIYSEVSALFFAVIGLIIG